LMTQAAPIKRVQPNRKAGRERFSKKVWQGFNIALLLTLVGVIFGYELKESVGADLSEYMYTLTEARRFVKAGETWKAKMAYLGEINFSNFDCAVSIEFLNYHRFSGGHLREITDWYQKLVLEPNTAKQFTLAYSLYMFGGNAAATKRLAVLGDRAALRHCLLHLRGNLVLAKSPKKAIAYYERSLAFSPDFYYAHVNLLNLYSLTNQKKKAAAQRDKVLRLRPNDFVGHYFVARYHLQNNEKKSALKHIGLSLQLNPRNRLAELLKQRLTKN